MKDLTGFVTEYRTSTSLKKKRKLNPLHYVQ